VLVRHDGQAGLDAVTAEGEQFDLIVTDHSMPRLSGLQLAARVRERHPDLPIILCTGYQTGIVADDESPVDLVLGKPFAVQTLIEAADRFIQASPRSLQRPA